VLQPAENNRFPVPKRILKNQESAGRYASICLRSFMDQVPYATGGSCRRSLRNKAPRMAVGKAGKGGQAVEGGHLSGNLLLSGNLRRHFKNSSGNITSNPAPSPLAVSTISADFSGHGGWVAFSPTGYQYVAGAGAPQSPTVDTRAGSRSPAESITRTRTTTAIAYRHFLLDHHLRIRR
jgi:hypothetical protein